MYVVKVQKSFFSFQTDKLTFGGFGQIYKAQDLLLNNRIVVIKAEPAHKGDRAQLPMELHVLKRYQGMEISSFH